MKSKQKSIVNIILYWLFSRSMENNNVYVNVLVCACLFVFTFCVSWECREGWRCESGVHGAYPLIHTVRREGKWKAYRLTWTRSVPASSSQGKLIVVWSTNKSQQNRTNEQITMSDWWRGGANWHLHPIALCSHTILPLEWSQKWSRATFRNNYHNTTSEKLCVFNEDRKQTSLAKSIFWLQNTWAKRGVFEFLSPTLQGQGQIFHKAPLKSTLMNWCCI